MQKCRDMSKIVQASLLMHYGTTLGLFLKQADLPENLNVKFVSKAKAHSAMWHFFRASLCLAFGRLHTCTDIAEKVCALSPLAPNPYVLPISLLTLKHR